MKKRICIVYSTIDGQTRKICQRIFDRLKKLNNQVDMIAIESFDTDLKQYDFVLLGASIRYGKHNQAVYNFIDLFEKELNKINSAFFSVNLVARKIKKSIPDNNPYVLNFFNEIKWRPKVIDVFAGVLDYSKYTFKDKIMIKLIMLLTKGPLTTKEPIEFTNWNKVDRLADHINQFRIRKPELLIS